MAIKESNMTNNDTELKDSQHKNKQGHSEQLTTLIIMTFCVAIKKATISSNNTQHNNTQRNNNKGHTKQ